MNTPTVAEFLLARIAEDEGMPEITFSQFAGPATQERVLAECEAKRRIVQSYNEREDVVTFDFMDADGGPWSSCSDWCPGIVMQGVLQLLAQPYADHPDFREEWRVA